MRRRDGALDRMLQRDRSTAEAALQTETSEKLRRDSRVEDAGNFSVLG